MLLFSLNHSEFFTDSFLQIHFYRFIVLPDLVKIRSNPSTICIFVIAYYYPFCKRTFISQIVC